MEAALRSYVIKGPSGSTLAFELPSKVFYNVEDEYIVSGASRIAIARRNTNDSIIRLGLHKPKTIIEYYDTIVPLLGKNVIKLDSRTESVIKDQYIDCEIHEAVVFTGNESFVGIDSLKGITNLSIVFCADLGPFGLLVPKVGMVIKSGDMVGFVLPEPSLVYAII